MLIVIWSEWYYGSLIVDITDSVMNWVILWTAVWVRIRTLCAMTGGGTTTAGRWCAETVQRESETVAWFVEVGYCHCIEQLMMLLFLWRMWLRGELLCTHCTQSTLWADWHNRNPSPNHNPNLTDGHIYPYAHTSHFATSCTDSTYGMTL